MDFQNKIREEQLKDMLNIQKSVTTFSEESRKELAKKGEAMPDGSFPIRNKQDLKDAARQWGRAKDPEAAKRHIVKRAKELGATEDLPEKWDIKKSVFAEFEFDIDNISKGILGDFTYSDKFDIKKNGKELKEALSSKIAEEVIELNNCKRNLDSFVTEIGEKPTCDLPSWTTDAIIQSLSDIKIYAEDTAPICNPNPNPIPLDSIKIKYNNEVFRYLDLQREILRINTIIRNMKDSNIYSLNVSQATILGF